MYGLLKREQFARAFDHAVKRALPSPEDNDDNREVDWPTLAAAISSAAGATLHPDRQRVRNRDITKYLLGFWCASQVAQGGGAAVEEFEEQCMIWEKVETHQDPRLRKQVLGKVLATIKAFKGYEEVS
jgi:hypothetical protein